MPNIDKIAEIKNTPLKLAVNENPKVNIKAPI
jgi:hypothetical protein